jgi:plasmid segregation protein ParM
MRRMIMRDISINVGQGFGSVDLGFGQTKIKRGENQWQLPSVTGPSRKLLDIDLMTKDPLQHIHDLKRDLFVGDLALRQSATKNFSLKEEKMEQEGTRSILEAALALMVGGSSRSSINLVSGLPVTFYFEQKKKMEDLLQGSHRVQIQAAERTISKTVTVERVKILPQPLGSALDFILDHRGKIQEEMKQFARGSIGVLDIGFFTTDLLVLSGMEILQDYSRSLRSGMSVAYKAMNDAGIDLPIYELDGMIRAGYFFGAAEKAKKALADQIIGEVETYWRELDVILVTGGGGAALYSYLSNRLPAKKMIQCQGSWSNVDGYEKAGRREWK